MVDYSYQLYSSRKFGPIRDTLRMLAEAGYAQIECFGDLITSSDLSDGIEETELKVPTAHVSLQMVEQEPDQVLRYANNLGIRQLYVPFLMPNDRPSDAAGWTEFGSRLAAAGQPFQAAGIGFGWHNHDFEFLPLDDGRMPIECILGADDKLILELDVAWVQVAGVDPFAWIDRLGNQLGAVHIKDIAPEGTCTDEDGWADVGYGTMAWKALSVAVDRTSATYRIMEHDNPNDDRRFAERSIAFVKSL